MKLTYNQKIAYKYYRAYGKLCHSVGEGIEKEEADEFRKMRALIFSKYKKYDPDNSFDVSIDYDLDAGEVVSM